MAGAWLEVENQRMDAMIVVGNGRAACRRLRDLRQGDQVVVGMRGIRVIPESKERDRLAFAFMSNGISSERQVETAVRQTASLMQQAREAEQKIIVVGGPVVVHTGGAPAARPPDPRGLGAGAARGKCAGRARYRSVAARNFAGRSPKRRPPGRARPSQSHARHQRDLSRGRHRQSGGERTPHERRDV